MSNTVVIQEFLAKLGFQVDQPSLGKFQTVLQGTSRSAAVLGTTIAGVAVAAELMVSKFASSMTRLYYASQLSGSSVGNLMAMEAGATRIGLAAETTTQLVKRMTLTIMGNPGIGQQLRRYIGDFDANNVLEKFVEFEKRMLDAGHAPQAFSIAEMFFGMDPETLMRFVQNFPAYLKAKSDQVDMTRSMGIDPQKAAESAVEYKRIWADIEMRLGGLTTKASIELLPVFEKMAHVILDAVKTFSDFMSGQTFASWTKDMMTVLDGMDELVKGNFKKALEIFKPVYEKANRSLGKSLMDGWRGTGGDESRSSAPITPPKLGEAGSPPAAQFRSSGIPTDKMNQARHAYLNQLEKQFGLDRDVLWGVYGAESNFGRHPNTNVENAYGALGPWQTKIPFMKDWGRNKEKTDRLDFDEGAIATARALASYLAQDPKGGIGVALAKVQQGPGNWHQIELGNRPMPGELLTYLNRVAPIIRAAEESGVSINQTNNINVNGAGDPDKVAERVVSKIIDPSTIRQMGARQK